MDFANTKDWFSTQTHSAPALPSKATNDTVDKGRKVKRTFKSKKVKG